MHGYDRVVTIGCDMPHLPPMLLGAIIAQAPAYCREAPILGCWPAALSGALDDFVEQDPKRAIRGWAASIGAAAIAATTPLANINTPGDLAAL